MPQDAKTRWPLTALLLAASLTLSLGLPSSALGATSIESFEATPSSTQAGGHSDWSVSFSLASSESAGTAHDITYNAPQGAGLLPSNEPLCSGTEFARTECAPDSQVGIVTIRARYEGNPEYVLGTAPVFDLEPSGKFGQLAFTIPTLNVPVVATLSLREASDYGLRLALKNLPEITATSAMKLTLWGVPAGPSNNTARFPRGSADSPPGCPASEEASCNSPNVSSAPEAPFTLNPTTCIGSLLKAELDVQTYQDPSAITRAANYPESTGCDQLGFNPSLYATLTTSKAYSPTGLEVELAVPQQQSPTIPGPSELYGVLVRLPKGMDINPELPEESVACSEAEAALESEEPATCPAEAELGSARVELADLPQPLVGGIYLAAFGSVEEPLLLLIAKAGGVELKLPIRLGEEAESGRLLLELAQPQLPISDYHLDFSGGPTKLFRTPLYCGEYPIAATFIPWDQTLGAQTSQQNIEITSGPDGAPCLGKAADVGIKLAPAELLADGKSQTKATVEITDAEGAGIPEEEVKLSSSDPGQHLGRLTDNENGTYSALITSSTTPGTSTVTATDLSASPELSGSATLTQLTIPQEPQQTIKSPPPAPRRKSTSLWSRHTRARTEGRALSSPPMRLAPASVASSTALPTIPAARRSSCRNSRSAPMSSRFAPARRRARAAPPSGTSECWEPSARTGDRRWRRGRGRNGCSRSPRGNGPDRPSACQRPRPAARGRASLSAARSPASRTVPATRVQDLGATLAASSRPSRGERWHRISRSAQGAPRPERLGARYR